jgi:hypothetical protein
MNNGNGKRTSGNGKRTSGNGKRTSGKRTSGKIKKAKHHKIKMETTRPFLFKYREIIQISGHIIYINSSSRYVFTYPDDNQVYYFNEGFCRPHIRQHP